MISAGPSILVPQFGERQKEIRGADSPPCFLGVFQRRLDQDVEITRRAIRYVRQDRDSPDHYIGHAFSVE